MKNTTCNYCWEKDKIKKVFKKHPKCLKAWLKYLDDLSKEREKEDVFRHKITLKVGQVVKINSVPCRVLKGGSILGTNTDPNLFNNHQITPP